MNTAEIEKLLTDKGVKPTANRILVMKALAESDTPQSLADLEVTLDTVDRASIFRVLGLFAEKEVVHVIDDGTRSVKYEVCHSAHQHTVADHHVHFHCEKCGRLYCFEHLSVPQVATPEGFEVKSINFMLKGLCPKCSHRGC